MLLSKLWAPVGYRFIAVPNIYMYQKWDPNFGNYPSTIYLYRWLQILRKNCLNCVLLSAFGVWPVLAWVYLERFCRKGHLWEFHFEAHEGLGDCCIWVMWHSRVYCKARGCELLISTGRDQKRRMFTSSPM